MKDSRAKTIFFSFLFLLVLTGFGKRNVCLADYQFKLTFELNYHPDELRFGKINEYDLISMEDADYLSLEGKPFLPSHRIRYAVPDGMKVDKVTVLDFESEIIPGQFNIFPAQPPIPIDEVNLNIEFREPDQNVYGSNNPYPDRIFKFIRQADLAGQSFIEIDVYPVRYYPAQQKVELFSNIVFNIEGNNGYICGDYLSPNATEMVSENYRNRLQKTVFNPGEISLVPASTFNRGFGPLPDGGPFDYIIITTDELTEYYAPLILWRTQQGLKAVAVSVEDIYSNYSGSDEKEKIRSFIIDAHQTWGTMYFLLGGEDHMIPMAFRNYMNVDVPSDAYYADYDDDWEYEVYVGRITAEDSIEIGRFINKVIAHETNPPSLSFPLNVTLFGMDLVIPGDPPTVIHMGQMVKDSIDTNILPFYLNILKIYDSDPGNHHDAFVNAINSGQNIFNHVEHGGDYNLATGWDQHGWMFFDEEIADLINFNMYFNMYTVGCHTCHIDKYYDVISESFILSTDSTGAVSWTGNTRNGWSSAGNPIGYSNALDYYWNEGLFTQNIYRAGEILAYAKSASPTEESLPYCEWELILVGDPAMPIRNNAAYYLIVDHPSECEAQPGDFAVHVELSDGSAVDSAFVCLWSGGQDYQRDYTDTNGDVVLNFFPTSGDPVFVTVTKQNAVPYQSEIQIVGNIPPQCVIPGDTVILLCEPGDIFIPVGCFDPDGNLESGPYLIDGPGQILEGNWIYEVLGPDTVTVTIECLDSMGYSLQETFSVLIMINGNPVLTVPNDTGITQEWPISEISLPIAIEDENIGECQVIEGPGVIEGDYWIFTPDNNIEADIIIQAIDNCGQTDEKQFHLTFTLNNICGDVNHDNSVNLLDILGLIDFLYMGGTSPDPYYIGDVDGNVVVNILDITYFINFLYTNGPVPDCGLLK